MTIIITLMMIAIIIVTVARVDLADRMYCDRLACSKVHWMMTTSTMYRIIVLETNDRTRSSPYVYRSSASLSRCNFIFILLFCVSVEFRLDSFQLTKFVCASRLWIFSFCLLVFVSPFAVVYPSLTENLIPTSICATNRTHCRAP